jgi:hypothetical protein
MRAGVTLSVSSADLDRLPALVNDRNALLLYTYVDDRACLR